MSRTNTITPDKISGDILEVERVSGNDVAELLVSTGSATREMARTIGSNVSELYEARHVVTTEGEYVRFDRPGKNPFMAYKLVDP